MVRGLAGSRRFALSQGRPHRGCCVLPFLNFLFNFPHNLSAIWKERRAGGLAITKAVFTGLKERQERRQ